MAFSIDQLRAVAGNAADALLQARDLDAIAFQAEQAVGLRCRLADYVHDCFVRAKRHKETTLWRKGASVHETMMRCLRMRNDEYDPELARALDGIDVYMPLGSMKVRAAQAWIRDTLANAEDKPWTVEPTPIPELSDSGKQLARQAFLIDLQQHGVLLDRMPPALAAERIKQLEDVAQDVEMEQAREACSRMEKLLQDQMVEGGWREAFDCSIDDLTVFPAAVLKSPIVRNINAPKWDGEQVRMQSRPKICFERVSPFDLYPSLDSTTPQDGSYLCERMPMTARALSKCMTLPNFSERAIRAAFTLYPTGYDCRQADSVERQRLEAVDSQLRNPAATYDVIDYWGVVEGDTLLEWASMEQVDPAVAFPQQPIDPAGFYEVNVWLLDRFVLRALFNPLVTGQRPYSVASFSRLPGSFWGEGLMQMLRDLQRKVNSTARRMVQNEAFSAGPLTEVNVDALDESEDVPHVIRPYRIFYTRGGQRGRAINFDKVPSVVGELSNVFDRFWRLADEVCGIPAYSYGGSAPTTGAAATMGGLSLLYNNALKGIKQAIGNLDKYLIEPAVTSLYLLNMLLYPDQSIKADAFLVARGAKGIMAREIRQARTVETLQAITPFATGPAPLIPQEGLVNLLREWLQLQGFNPDRIFGKQVPDELPQAGGAGATPYAITPGTPAPALDGRQAPAIAAIEGGSLT